jgi:hypothetical protein
MSVMPGFGPFTYHTQIKEGGRAADADPEWQPLQRDIEDFYSRQSILSQQTAANEMDAYFAADRRVQADCKSAGEDIGSLRPQHKDPAPQLVTARFVGLAPSHFPRKGGRR